MINYHKFAKEFFKKNLNNKKKRFTNKFLRGCLNTQPKPITLALKYKKLVNVWISSKFILSFFDIFVENLLSFWILLVGKQDMKKFVSTLISKTKSLISSTSLISVEVRKDVPKAKIIVLFYPILSNLAFIIQMNAPKISK